MATWIAHLRLAEILLEHIPGLDAAAFAIGSVAPDAGIPDEKWEKFTPPPEVTHFKRSDGAHKDLADLEFYRHYLACVKAVDTPHFSFRMGYFFHLITDNLWTVAVGRPTEERFAEQFAADRQFIWEVKKDWYGLDHLYVRDHPNCLFWRVFLDANPDGLALDFFPAEALPLQLHYIKSFYQRRDDKIQALYQRPYIYLSQAAMDDFVEQSAQRLFRIYNGIWQDHAAVEDFSSALEIF